MEFIYSTDWHLGKLRRFFPEDHVRITINEIQKPLDYAVKNGIQTIVFGGDLSDIPFLNQRYFKALLDLIRSFPELNFYLMLGNHDYEDAETHSLQFLEICEQVGIVKNVKVITTPTVFKVEKIPLNFVPFPYCQFKYKGPCFNFAHLDAKGAVRDNNKKINKGLEFPDKTQFNVIGHIHKFQIINEWTMYPGGLFQTTFGEAKPKGFTHYRARMKEGKLRVDYKYVENVADFELINLQMETRDDFKQIEKDPMKLYKLLVAEGVTVPKKLTTTHPNVIDIQSLRNGKSIYSKDLPPEIYEGSDTVENLVAADPLWGLREFLKKEGLDKQQRKRGMLLVEQILTQMELI